ncbi:MAG TPA: aspartyl protease family protein, partial [Niastella sp.]|nr:aspartyl protease family protein [Niastella sp.]
EKIDGIIGYSFINRYILKIDYDTLELQVWSRGSLKYPRGGYLMRPLITTLPVQQARVRDEVTINTRFLYDMGAGLCMMLSSDFVKDSALLDKKQKLFIKEAEGLGGKIDMEMTVLREVKIGPYRFKNVPVYIFDDVYNITSYPYLGGLIGNDLLRRFNVILNYDRRDIYLMPNKHYNDQFDYSYSGIELYYVDGEILVGDVAKGSPAEKAGVKEGDVVISVNSAFGTNLNTMKLALQNAGERVRLIVKSGGELKQYDFKVKSILSRR